MKKNVFVLASLLASFANASDKPEFRLNDIQPKFYYVLNRERARSLNLDYDLMVERLQVRQNERMLLHLNEENELNLSIFDDAAFSRIVADIVK